MNSGLDELSVNGLAMDPRNPAVLYACGPNGVYKTVTGGEVQSASIAVSAVVNGASNLAGPVSPGEIVVITGSGLGPGQLIPATPGTNGLYSAPTLGDHGSVQRDSGAIDLHLGDAGRCPSPGFSFRRAGTGHGHVRGAHVGLVPGSGYSVRSRSLHARLHRERTSGCDQSGRLDQYRL